MFPGGLLFPLLGLTLLLVLLLVLQTGPAGAQEIFLSPSAVYPTDFVFTVDIAIDCAGQDVKGVEAVLAFDPFLLHLDAITPGPWYTGTGQGYFFFDYTPIDPQGSIHFASTVLEGSNNQSLIIATCHFTAYGFGTTPVIFQDVDVRDPANVDLGFGHSTGDFIEIDPVIPVTSTSFGAVKALFR